MTRLGRKQKAILSALKERDWMPGPELADRIDVPAHVLWPYIERLRDRGYAIEGTKRGYRLAA